MFIKRIAERVLRSVDCGMTAFVNELYQFKVLVPLQEPELTDDELVALRQLIEERWPRIEDRAQLQDDITTNWTPFDSADEEARAVMCCAAADGPTPAGLSEAAHGVGPLTSDEFHCAAAAIRCWITGVNPDLVSHHHYLELADRLSTAALALTPVIS